MPNTWIASDPKRKVLDITGGIIHGKVIPYKIIGDKTIESGTFDETFVLFIGGRLDTQDLRCRISPRNVTAACTNVDSYENCIELARSAAIGVLKVQFFFWSEYTAMTPRRIRTAAP